MQGKTNLEPVEEGNGTVTFPAYSATSDTSASHRTRPFHPHECAGAAPITTHMASRRCIAGGAMPIHGGLQTHCGVNFFILDSRLVLAPAPKVLGPKHISNPDFAPF